MSFSPPTIPNLQLTLAVLTAGAIVLFPALLALC